MNVIGFNFNKIFVERKDISEESLRDIKIKSNISIKNIEPLDFSIKKENSTLSIKFEFLVEYEPDFAKIILEGNVMVSLPEKISSEVLSKWNKKEKEFDEKLRIPLFNFIIAKCNIKSLQLEDELNLPLHLPFPKISPKNKDSNKNNSTSTYTG